MTLEDSIQKYVELVGLVQGLESRVLQLETQLGALVQEDRVSVAVQQGQTRESDPCYVRIS